MNLENLSILITGGTGSFGNAFVKTILNKYPSIKRLVIYSRDELKQYQMSQKFRHEDHPGIRYFIGDIRDEKRLNRAFENIDIVIHAAALKQVPAAEYNPFEFINTNIIGAENIINAALNQKVKSIVALSTDKAAAPINLYGATKLCSDKLFIAANNIKGDRDFKSMIVRYGNVMGSRGSVIPFFFERKKTGILPITDDKMSRFNITLEEGVHWVMKALETGLGGEIFVPKLPSYEIKTVAEAIAPECKHEIIGIRPGEKIHEDMVNDSDALNTLELEHHYIIHPNNQRWQEIREKLITTKAAHAVEDNFSYNSGRNTDWLSVKELRELIIEHLDPNFKV
tara:strand:+ start:185 stop:1204 length:1020 start_codon:yes stop_codon:yes gene_type:complete